MRKALLSCMDCGFWNAGSEAQRMGNLPECRVAVSEPPFNAAGVDLTGPINVKQGRSLVKRYAALFVCMALRAVHIEMVQSLETSAFIQAFKRFISRRGKPKQMFSDNGTNFKGADRQLNEGIKTRNDHNFQKTMSQVGIEWNYNVPRCSHSG